MIRHVHMEILHRDNVDFDVLFCSIPDMVKLWPEVEV
jgi:hypothetical protein